GSRRVQPNLRPSGPGGLRRPAEPRIAYLLLATADDDGLAAAVLAGAHESGDTGRDVPPESRAVEDAVVPDLGRFEMQAPVVRDARADPMGGGALTEPGDVVLFALDRHQGDTPYGGRVDLAPPVHHLSAW